MSGYIATAGSSAAALLGIASYFSRAADPHVNLQLHLLWYGAAALWSLIEGIYRLKRRCFFLVNGMLVHVPALVIGRFSILLVWSPVR